ncbi:putative reverse transcriptase domain-containing protein [Tanacetum coccineum]
MPNTRSGASRTRKGVNEQSDRRMAKALRARDAVRNLGPLMGEGSGQEEEWESWHELWRFHAGGSRNKRRMDCNPRDNRGQQPPLKRQNISGQNVARAYTAGNNERRGPRHFRKDCPKLSNQNRGNQTRNRVGNKTGNQTRGYEATAKAYAIGGGGTNPDSNIGALLDITPSNLDTSYAVELADGRISETNVVLRGCTLGLLGYPFNIDLMPIELGSFDVIIDMDWLAKYHALIVCDEKVIRIPYGDEKYIQKGYHVYLAQVSSKKAEDKSEEKRLEDVPTVQKFLKVFPKDLLDCHQLDKLNFKST